MAKSPTIAYEATYLQFMVQLPELSLKFRVVLGHASRGFEPFEPPRPVDPISCEAEQPCDEQLTVQWQGQEHRSARAQVDQFPHAVSGASIRYNGRSWRGAVFRLRIQRN